MGFLGDMLDGIHDIATAPVKAVEGALFGGSATKTKAKAKAAAKTAKASATAVLRPAEAKKVEKKRLNLASMAAPAKQQGAPIVIRPYPQPNNDQERAALTFIQRLMDDRWELTNRAIAFLLSGLNGLSSHVEVVEAELLGKITFVETVVAAQLTQQLADVRGNVFMFMQEAACSIVDEDADLSREKRSSFQQQFKSAGDFKSFYQAWTAYKTASASLWNRVTGSAYSWVPSLLLTGAMDFSILGASRNARMAVALDAVVALLLGNSRPQWLVAGGVPIITLLSSAFQIPNTATATVEITGSPTTVALPSPGVTFKAKVVGLPDLFVSGSASFDVVETRLESARCSYRATPTTSATGLSAASLVAGKEIEFFLPRTDILLGDVTDSRVMMRIRGASTVSGQARETVCTSTGSPRPIPVP